MAADDGGGRVSAPSRPGGALTKAEVQAWVRAAYPTSAYEITAYSSLGRPMWRVVIETPGKSGNPYRSMSTVETFERKA